MSDKKSRFDEVEIDLGLDEPDDPGAVRARVARRLAIDPHDLPQLELKKRAIDARGGRVRFHLTLAPVIPGAPPLGGSEPREVDREARVVVVGDGPAGLFCAYELARQGIGSIVLDRGKPVQPRRRDLKGLTQHGRVDPDSNYCFGEGGAGTYSDGKLYTRSHKRGDVRDVLEVLRVHGAPDDILVDARPHIGSNKLPKVISAHARAPDQPRRARSASARASWRCAGRRAALCVRLSLDDGAELPASAVVLATGHSARDVYELLDDAGVRLVSQGLRAGRAHRASAAADRSHPVRSLAPTTRSCPTPPIASRTPRSSAACSRSACARAASSCRPPPSRMASSSTA